MKTHLMFLLFALFAVACTPPPPPFAHDDAPAPTVEPAVYPTAPVVDAPPVVVVVPAPLPPIRVHVDERIEERAAVLEAVEAWRVATRGVRDWVYVGKDDPADVWILEVGPYARVCPGAPEETTAWGCVQQIGGLWASQPEPLNVFLISGNYEAGAKLTAMHEIGHLLGLTHADGGFMTGNMPIKMALADWECPDAEPLDRLQIKLGITGLTACAAPTEKE